jgi:hypothetical protein
MEAGEQAEYYLSDILPGHTPSIAELWAWEAQLKDLEHDAQDQYALPDPKRAARLIMWRRAVRILRINYINENIMRLEPIEEFFATITEIAAELRQQAEEEADKEVADTVQVHIGSDSYILD